VLSQGDAPSRGRGGGRSKGRGRGRNREASSPQLQPEFCEPQAAGTADKPSKRGRWQGGSRKRRAVGLDADNKGLPLQQQQQQQQQLNAVGVGGAGEAQCEARKSVVGGREEAPLESQPRAKRRAATTARTNLARGAAYEMEQDRGDDGDGQDEE